jgi:class 3 adenylate cyclase
MTSRTPRILAVDDEPANLALLAKLLGNTGYEVVQASDGPAAIAAAEDQRPDLILLDVLMPGIDGIETCQRLRARAPFAHVPILMLTALNHPEDRARGLEAGANDFLSKPFEAVELSARIRTLLKVKALQDRLVEILGRYVSDSVAEQILRDPFAVSLGGDRRLITTFFADIRGYTSLAASRRPEETLELLNRYLTVSTDAVIGHGGTVADLLGDGVYAFFGAPVIHADDPWRAVQAALALQKSIGEVEVPGMPGVRLQCGIGIATGEVIAGNVGSERRMHYAVVGDSVQVAARLQNAAGPGQILADEPTYKAVEPRIIAQDLGTLRLAGKGEWTQTYSILAAKESVPSGQRG